MKIFVGFVCGLVLGILIGLYVRPTWNSNAQSEKNKSCLQNSINEMTLSPPIFSASLPETLETNHESEVMLKWDPVDGAKSYEILVMNNKDQVVKKYKTTRTIIYLKDIPKYGDAAVEYNVALSSVNLSDKPGPFGPKRKLIVKGQGPVFPPQIKTIRIE